MTKAALERGTGRPVFEWQTIIADAGLAGAPHKEIADYLHANHGVSSWWAQEITVEYERLIGRRVHGQTQDGRFQIGVSKTVNAGADRLWNVVAGDRFIDALVSPDPASVLRTVDPGTLPNEARLAGLNTGTDDGPIEAETTTFERGSHVRMRWRLRDWPDHSTLQVRVTPKAGEKATLAFHHERLPSAEVREQMRGRWKAVAAAVASLIGTG